MIAAIILTPYVKRWLDNAQSPRLIHLFDHACNLSNEAGEILSIVQPQIGAGPFALVVAETRPFSQLFSLDAPIQINPDSLQIGSLMIDLQTASLWNPVMDWDGLREHTVVWQPKLPELRQIVTAYRTQIGAETAVAEERLQTGLNRLLNGLKLRDRDEIQAGARQIAGLGRGLTPAGDDMLMGVIYGLWATCPHDDCQPLIDLLVETAVPRTTSLSGAWLQAAGQGQASELWHSFSDQFSVNSDQWQDVVKQILGTGHSSGSDALWGFTAVCQYLMT